MIGARLLCLLGIHRRSRTQARRDGRGWRSRCDRCGVAMRRQSGGTWSVDRSPPKKG